MVDDDPDGLSCFEGLAAPIAHVVSKSAETLQKPVGLRCHLDRLTTFGNLGHRWPQYIA